MNASAAWFDVDRKGLQKILERRGKEFVVYELLSNCFDTAAKRITVNLTKVQGSPKVKLLIEDDDPDGFQTLSHAWTLFAESNRKGHADKRGRFNLGEKIVLASCYEAEIRTTTGAIRFDDEGRHVLRSVKTAKGSIFSAIVRMNAEEFETTVGSVKRILVPEGIEVVVNGETLPHRVAKKAIKSVYLPTVVADDEGYLKQTTRSTSLEVHDPAPGEKPTLYEMGIPVVELDVSDRYHVNVLQKIPQNLDRDNVDSWYLGQVRVATANAMRAELTIDDAAGKLASEALENKDAEPETVERILTLRFGDKRAIWDPSDLEANNNLVAEGYTLIKGAQLTKDAWNNVRRFQAAKPAGQIRPTRKALFSPDGEDAWVPEEKWTWEVARIVKHFRILVPHLIDTEVFIGVVSSLRVPWGACFGDGQFVLNLARLGHDWFSYKNVEVQWALLIHELGHHLCQNHLDEEYHKGLCRLGAKLAWLMYTEPGLLSGR